MAKHSPIEWTHHTFNPWWGCVKVSTACKHCYAESFSNRFHKGKYWGARSERRLFGDKHWSDPLGWNDEAEKEGVRRRVFCASMADWAEDRSDLDESRLQLYALIEQTPWLDWLLLTKRIEHVSSVSPWGNHWPDNVWLGTTVENQKYAELRVPELIKHPAAVKFLSCEPLLGAVDLSAWVEAIDWVIAGGESGPKSRPMNPRWT